LQALDMNQEGYLEEALKLPNALQFLGRKSSSGRPVVIAGLREHIFTHSLSAPAFFMSQQEYVFGTMWQRIMASPLRVRMHYGHPDIFDKVFMMSRGGTAKSSAVM
jgi:callose synthase